MAAEGVAVDRDRDEVETDQHGASKASRRLHLAIFAAFFVFGYQQGAKQIHDNGTFTHLRTGIDMANTGAIPRTDPYSFTARGHAWTVQSWLPEWTYGWAYRIGGYKFV